MRSSREELVRALEHGFLDSSVRALERYSPKLVINDKSRNECVLPVISSELRTCDEFFFSVAFITDGGLSVLSNELRDLQERGVKGRIIASQYQNFTQPTALKRLASFENIELRVATEGQMHTKCYIFRRGDDYNLIIGSSNLTNQALCENKEWNLRISSSEDGGLIKEVLEEFGRLFETSTRVDEIWLGEYSKIYREDTDLRRLIRSKRYEEAKGFMDLERPQPNRMQVPALRSLEDMRSKGADRALIISATGTGKTYLSAFDVRKCGPKRMLYIAHRETILRNAKESYGRILGPGTSLGLLTGNSRDSGCDFLFSTIQTISKEDVLSDFKPEEFDYIVVDEVHRAGARSYKRVLDHFRPKFVLGMSATPERNDGIDIFEMFDHNVAYEIRLRQAMEEKMICPFHYFGVSDITVGGEPLDDLSDFNRLVSDQRVEHVLRHVRYYLPCGDRVRGLVFCSGREEAETLSDRFNEKGYMTRALTGKDSQDDREEAIRMLEADDPDPKLDYIFTVDIFNEGVDIPRVNQIVMLRPTESAIVFVQQLGRGLRHSEDKEYVTVIDFIGNYQKNYLIPVALSGDRSYNKDVMRRFVSEGNRMIPGCSAIAFDSITKERIYSAIDRANLNGTKLLREAYRDLRNKLGRVPTLSDFREFGSVDPIKIIERFGSYHSFLRKYEKEYGVRLPEDQEAALCDLSGILASGKRLHEILIAEAILSGERYPLRCLRDSAPGVLGHEVGEQTLRNLANIFAGRFHRGRDNLGILEGSGVHYTVSERFSGMIRNGDFARLLSDTVACGRSNWKERYSEPYPGTNLCLYERYTYADACRLLDWDREVIAQNIGGYMYNKETNTLPVFINYVKGDDVADSIRYDDHFLNPSTLVGVSKSREGAGSKNVIRIRDAVSNGTVIPLFLRKNKDDIGSKEFYYLGNMLPEECPVASTAERTPVEILYRLERPVRADLYEYFTTVSLD